MPAFDYGRMQATASRLLARFAQGSVVLKKVTVTPGAQSWDSPTETVVDHILQGAVRGVSERFVDGSAILSTDLQMTAAVFGATPAPGDVVTIDGDPVTLLRVDAIPAAGTVVAWRLFLRD